MDLTFYLSNQPKTVCWTQRDPNQLKLLFGVICLISESSMVENSKPNGHSNGSVTSSPTKGDVVAEAEVDPGPEGPKRAFLSLEQVEKGQAKASVLEVFKKVWDWLLWFCLDGQFVSLCALVEEPFKAGGVQRGPADDFAISVKMPERP